MEFSERLVQVRKARGLSQENLAEQVGVSRQAVSKWETGEALPDYAKLVALADVFAISLDDLCGRAGQTGSDTEQPGSAPPPARKASPLRVIAALVLALALFGIGLWTGTLLPVGPAEADTAEQDPVPPLPDVVTVSGVKFSHDGSALTYQFVPSVAGEGYTFQIRFRSYSGETYTETPQSEGGCFGKIDLASGSDYTVTACISNGVETRLVLLASDLSFGNNLTSWTPAS